MSENPYKAPVSGLEAAATNTAGTLVDARTVDAGRGWEWIVEGFALFKKQPGMWILVLVVLLVCSIVISLVPVVGTLINMVIVQIFMGGLMLGCRALDGDGTLELSHLFAGFNQKTSDLVVLGVLALIGWIIAFIPALLIVGGCPDDNDAWRPACCSWRAQHDVRARLAACARARRPCLHGDLVCAGADHVPRYEAARCDEVELFCMS